MNGILSVKEQEQKMMQSLIELNIQHFLFFFNIYQCTDEKSSDSIFFKAAALLLYISEGNIVEFNKLIQTLTMEDIENEYVKLVLRTHDCISGFDFEALKNIAVGKHERFGVLIQKIYEKQITSLDKALMTTTGTFVATSGKPDANTIISDCLFVIDNFAGN